MNEAHREELILHSTGCVYMRRCVPIAMSYNGVGHGYSDIASAGTYCDAQSSNTLVLKQVLNDWAITTAQSGTCVDASPDSNYTLPLKKPPLWTGEIPTLGWQAIQSPCLFRPQISKQLETYAVILRWGPLPPRNYIEISNLFHIVDKNGGSL